MSFPSRAPAKAARLLPLCLLALLSACPQGGGKLATEKPAGQSAVAPPGKPAPEAPEAEAESVPAAEEQLILFYTGDTFSQLAANETYSPPEGGLPALANTLGEEQRRVVEYVQTRLQNEGKDPAQAKADLQQSRLGGHPYILLDYGGWERIHDPQGDPYVAQYFQFFKDFNFTPVAAVNCDTAPDGLWERYAKLPDAPYFLSSGAQAPPPRSSKIYLRKVHGENWGFIAIPYLKPGSLDETAAVAEIQQRIDTGYQALGDLRSKYFVLLAPNIMQRAVYDKLKDDPRFIAVIGGPPSMAPAEGFGKLSSGPLMLPALQGGGRELGICHFIYGESGKPLEYSFRRVQVIEDASAPYPYRKQCAGIVEAHRQAGGSEESLIESPPDAP